MSRYNIEIVDLYDSIKSRIERAKRDSFNLRGSAETSASVVAHARASAEREDTPEAWKLYRDCVAEHEADHGPLQPQP